MCGAVSVQGVVMTSLRSELSLLRVQIVNPVHRPVGGERRVVSQYGLWDLLYFMDQDTSIIRTPH